MVPRVRRPVRAGGEYASRALAGRALAGRALTGRALTDRQSARTQRRPEPDAVRYSRSSADSLTLPGAEARNAAGNSHGFSPEAF